MMIEKYPYDFPEATLPLKFNWEEIEHEKSYASYNFIDKICSSR